MTTRKVLFITFLINTVFILIGLFIVKSPLQYFGKEASVITWLSFFQLLTIAYLSWKTFKLRKEKSAILWGLIALGFLFLSIDEVARIHENMDSFIHKRILHMRETAISDRLDDLIVGIYALFGIGTMYFFREELKKYYKVIPYFVIGFIFIFSMVIVELIVNRFDVLPSLIADRAFAKSIYKLGKIMEETFKLFAEGVLIGAFYYCLQLAKQFVTEKK